MTIFNNQTKFACTLHIICLTIILEQVGSSMDALALTLYQLRNDVRTVTGKG